MYFQGSLVWTLMLAQTCVLMSAFSLVWPKFMLLPLSSLFEQASNLPFDRSSSHGTDGWCPGGRWWPLLHLEPAQGCNCVARLHDIKPVINLLQEPCCCQLGQREIFLLKHVFQPSTCCLILNTLRAGPTFILSKWLGSMAAADRWGGIFNAISSWKANKSLIGTTVTSLVGRFSLLTTCSGILNACPRTRALFRLVELPL